MLLRELSEGLEEMASIEGSSEIWASNTSGLVVFIVERSTGYLMATSTGADDYFDFDRFAFARI